MKCMTDITHTDLHTNDITTDITGMVLLILIKFTDSNNY